MDLTKIYTDSDFANAVVPAGQILVFTGIENEKPVTRYKDSSGNFGTLSGNGGGSVDVILGQVNADRNFQPLAFNGTEASNSGSPEAVEAYYGFNGVLPVPDSGGGGGGSKGCDYYKCASVDTANKTWTGYKAVLTDGVYTFEETLTAGLTYGTAYTPEANRIYDADALVQVRSLFQGLDETIVFHAPLQSASTAAETGQPMTVSGNVEYLNVENRECAYFDGESKLVITDVSALPFGSSQHTICGWFRYSEFAQFRGLLGYGYEYAIRATSYYGECDVVYYSNTGGAFAYHLEADRWYHIATTWDGTTIRLYIDGVITSTNSEAPSFYRSESNPLWIGGVPRTGTGTGYVSDVRIYNRALLAEEIAALAAE